MQTKSQGGFTIIELMIVVAILGVLASIALPIYQDYMLRARVSESMYLLAGLKKPMIEYYGTWGEWPSVEQVGGAASGTYTNKITSGQASEDVYYVEAAMKGEGEMENAQLRMTYNTHTREWICTTDGTTKPIPEKYLASVCKQD